MSAPASVPVIIDIAAADDVPVTVTLIVEVET